MIYGLTPFHFFLIFTVLLVLAFLAGRWIRQRFGQRQDNGNTSFYVEGTLLSLLFGFTFGMAQSSYHKRRELMDREINNFTTAMTYISMYPDTVAGPIRTHMKQVLQARVDYYRAGKADDKISASLNRTDSLARMVLGSFAHLSEQPEQHARNLLLGPSLNNLFDGFSSSELYRGARIPLGVLRMLFLLSMVASFINGYNQGKGKVNQVQMLGFALLLSLTFYLILDLGDTREGYINLGREVGMLEKNLHLFKK